MIPLAFAFARGFDDGALLGERTAREAARDYPEFTTAELEAYGQGTVDGAAGDDWRLRGLGR